MSPYREDIHAAGESLLRRIEAVMQRVDFGAFVQLVDDLSASKRIFVAGAGRSGMVARMFGMRLMHAGLTAHVTGETITPAAGPGDLLVAISCTGATGYTDYLVRKAHDLGASVAVLTAVADAPLTTAADRVIRIPCDEADVVTRATVFEHATGLCLDAVFNVLSERLKVDTAAFQARHANLE